MKKLSWYTFNELWRNGRLTITTIIIPVIGLLILMYRFCDPFHRWVDQKIEKILFWKERRKFREL